MQIRHSFLTFAALVVMCLGEDAASKLPPFLTASRSGSAWLGFSVSKPDPVAAAQIPTLPPGVGFVIQAVTSGGPAELAQINPKDVLWKFGDQLLVNQGQLAALLNLQQPGDEVSLGIFRDGKPAEIKIKLGEAPAEEKGISRDMIDAAILPDEGSTMKIITLLDRTATFSSAEGKALVRHDGEGYKVLINGPDKKIIFDGSLAEDGNADRVPAEWRRRVCVLRRSLDHALENRIVPVISPRPRVVTPVPVPPESAAPPPGLPFKP